MSELIDFAILQQDAAISGPFDHARLINIVRRIGVAQLGQRLIGLAAVAQVITITSRGIPILLYQNVRHNRPRRGRRYRRRDTNSQAAAGLNS